MKERHTHSLQEGFTIVDIAMGMSVFLMMALLFGAVVPITLRQTQQSANYSEAALVAQHKMEELRAVNFTTLGSSTALIASGLIDAQNPDGSYDFSTTTSDNLASFFPSGTTGNIVIASDTSTGSMQSSVYDVTITLSWPSSATHAGSFTLKNKIINY